MISTKFCCIIIVLTFLPCCLFADEDYYKLLGVERNADLREIRRAFKKLAVTKHPDKNPDDAKAHDLFVKLAEAYEILKDPTKRSEYDRFGSANFKNQSPPRYHSYTYYRDQFGIYDDDPLIATLTDDEFESSLQDTVWFINFYSPLCSHCHHLAPEWRQLAEQLQGVVKVGAVNCEDERQLCWKLEIRQFPSLLYYTGKTSMNGGREYFGRKTADAMEEYVMDQLSPSIQIPNLTTLPKVEKTPWLLYMCSTNEECLEERSRFKITAVLKGLVSVGLITDSSAIKDISGDETSKTLLVEKSDAGIIHQHILHGSDFIEITNKVLESLPEAKKIDTDGFSDIRTQLRIGSDIPWLLCFTLGLDTQTTIMLKKLSASLDGFNIGEVNCARSSGLCASLHIAKYPTWAILKKGGAFEMHSGRSALHSVESFAKETQQATNLHALSPPDVQKIMSSGTPWIIGWLLTGCPPCKRMLPALRKASSHFEPDIIQFGTVDCAVHHHICSRYNVHSYPTTVIYNASSTITFTGESNEKAIIEFIKMIKANYVKSLTKDTFYDEVGQKNELDMYIVEFYAPWCAPCQKLQPEWRKMAQKLSHLKRVHVGAVNCESDRELCIEQGVNSYPTIRLYPTGSHGLNTMAIYSGHQRDTHSLHKWVLNFLPRAYVDLTAQNYEEQLLSKKEDRIWIVMFYAPWCGFCHQFEPDFITVVQKLSNYVVAGKVNCQRDGVLCNREDINSYPTVKVFQRVDGVTKLAHGITIEEYTQESLYAEVKALLANAYITPLEHDEL